MSAGITVPPPRLPSHLHLRSLQEQEKLTSLSLELACDTRKPGWRIRHLGHVLLLSASNCSAGNFGRKDPEERRLGWGRCPGSGTPTLLACLAVEADIITGDNDHSTARVHFPLTPDLTSHCPAPESDPHTPSHGVYLRPCYANACLPTSPCPLPRLTLIFSFSDI